MSEDLPMRRLALLVDAENINPEYMRQILPQVFKLGRPSIQFAYGDFSNPSAKPWVEYLRANIIEARQVTPAQSGKNAADIALVVDAMNLALRDKCDCICIVSSDRDFVALTTFLKAEGIDVFGFGKAGTNKKYRQSCAKFFELNEDDAKVAPKPAQAAVQLAIKDWHRIRQEIAQLADKQGWTPLQALGCVLGKHALRAKDYGGTNWAQVLGKISEVELCKDVTGRHSVRIVAAKAA